MANTEHIITILDRQKVKVDGKKTLVRPSKRAEQIGRRRLGAAITFYDLAQIKSGDTYVDHPILKVPGYSIAVALSGGGVTGATYTIDPFLEADYQAFTASLFAIGPVTEWKNLFKKLQYSLGPTNTAAPAPYPTKIGVRTVPQTGVITTIFPIEDAATGLGSPVSFFLDLYGMCWDTPGLKYKNFTEITLRPYFSTDKEWFSSSTGTESYIKDTYKVTATNDSSAPDVGAISISGNIDVYLVPQIGMFIGESVGGPHDLFGHSSTNGVDVIGPWYQVNPRAYWPAFVDPYALADQDALNQAFRVYQCSRADAQASHWTNIGSSMITSGPLSPASFASGKYTWKTFISNTNASTLYGGDAHVFRLSSGSSASAYMYCEAPFLMAVMKIHGHFYYVWCLDGAGSDNVAAGESRGLAGYTISSYDALLDAPP